MPRRDRACGDRQTTASPGRGCWRPTSAAAASIWRCGPIDPRTCCSHRAGRTNKPPCIAFLVLSIDRRARGAPSPDMGRTSLAIAPSNPNIIYGSQRSNAPGPQGIYRQGLIAVYRSNYGGLPGTWQTRVSNSDPTFLNTLLLTNTSSAAPRVCNPQGSTVIPATMGWYNNVIAVDPRDPNRVWAAGVDWFRSDDGGQNWGLASWANPNLPSYSHVDQHAITFHRIRRPKTSVVLIVTTAASSEHDARAASRRVRQPPAGGRRSRCRTSLITAWVTQFYHGTHFRRHEYLLGHQATARCSFRRCRTEGATATWRRRRVRAVHQPRPHLAVESHGRTSPARSRRHDFFSSRRT